MIDLRRIIEESEKEIREAKDGTEWAEKVNEEYMKIFSALGGELTSTLYSRATAAAISAALDKCSWIMMKLVGDDPQALGVKEVLSKGDDEK